MKALKKTHYNLEEIINMVCEESDLKIFDPSHPDSIALLYLYGYLTIKDYDLYSNLVSLGIPNEEVKNTFQDWSELLF